MSVRPRHVFFADRNLGKQFPETLRKAGIAIEKHDDYFAHNTPDEEWLADIGKRGWYPITFDRRIRYKPNEKEAAKKFNVGLFVLVGKVPLPAFAQEFIDTLPKIYQFIDDHPRPFMAKIRPASKGRKSGSVELWESFGS